MINTIKLLELLNNNQLEDLKKALEENTREEAAKKNGTKNKLTIIKKLQKEAEKMPSSCRGVQPCNVGRVEYNGFMNSCMVLADSTTDYGYAKSENGFNCGKMFADIPEIRYNIDLDDLKQFIALDKANKKADRRATPKPYIIELEDGRRAGFNPVYLLNCLNFCDSTEIKLFTTKQTNNNCVVYKNPMQVSSADNSRLACLLPVNIA